jgi:hypothetical protein
MFWNVGRGNVFRSAFPIAIGWGLQVESGNGVVRYQLVSRGQCAMTIESAVRLSGSIAKAKDAAFVVRSTFFNTIRQWSPFANGAQAAQYLESFAGQSPEDFDDEIQELVLDLQRSARKISDAFKNQVELALGVVAAVVALQLLLAGLLFAIKRGDR